jgi:hypothetical protein
LCRSCENLSLYMAMLRDVSAELRPLLDAALLAAETSGEAAAHLAADGEAAAAAKRADADSDSDDDGEAAAAAANAANAAANAANADAAAADAAAAAAEAEADAEAEATGVRELDALLKLCSSPHKAALLNQLVCGGSVAKAKPECRDGDCTKCGMAALWSRGMRPKVIDEHGHFRTHAPAVWKTLLGWERYKAPPKSSSAAPTDEGQQHSEHGGKESMRQPRSGSIVAGLDEFENHVAKKAVLHRARQISTAEAARWCGPNPNPNPNPNPDPDPNPNPNPNPDPNPNPNPNPDPNPNPNPNPNLTLTLTLTHPLHHCSLLPVTGAVATRGR